MAGDVSQQMAKLVDSARQSLAYHEDSVVSSALDSIDGSSRTSEQTSADDIIPEQAKKLLIALSRSGLPEDRRLELSEMARKVWEE